MESINPEIAIDDVEYNDACDKRADVAALLP